MTAAQTAAKIRQNLADLRANRERELLIIGNDISALIKIRIQGSGENYLNTKFSPYSPSYAPQRAKAGFQISYKDFTRTGRFFASVYAEVDKDGNTIFTIIITPHGQDNINKALGAQKKDGNILRPSQEELNLAEEANNLRVQKYLQI
jgi:hypothetical protein